MAGCEPLGVVLVLAPGNYPLFLPGVQLLQALIAGNAVLVKPAPGCTAPLAALSALLEDAGLPSELVQLLDEDVASARAAIAQGVERVVLTGSAETGRAVLANLAPRLTPATLVTRGAEGLLELTCLKTISLRRGRLRPHYQPTTAVDQTLFRQYLRAVHGGGWAGRVKACISLYAALCRRVQTGRRTVADDRPRRQSK